MDDYPRTHAVASFGAAAEAEQDPLRQQTDPNSRSSSRSRRKRERNSLGLVWWQAYRIWARRHQDSLWFLDESVSRLLFWTPANNEQSRRWRQVVWGVLELHRLFLECALQNEENANNNTYGTSIHIQPDIPATSLRFALTALQSLWPVVQELVVVTAASSQDPQQPTRQQRQAAVIVRKHMERIRFVLRMTLLISYWRRMRMFSTTLFNRAEHHQRQRQQNQVLPGLLLQGGLYHAPLGYDVEHERARIQRQNFVGRRTGRRITSTTTVPTATATDSSFTAKLRILLGELLYVARPLVQAETEAATAAAGSGNHYNQHQQPSLQSWLICLAMDVTSLLSLRHQHDTGNAVTAAEWRRRRLRLLLYLLRSPVWDGYTERAVDRVGSAVHRCVPLAGGLFRNYLWDWVNYWRLYRAEEG